jgi:hypothetical protein
MWRQVGRWWAIAWHRHNPYSGAVAPLPFRAGVLGLALAELGRHRGNGQSQQNGTRTRPTNP